MIWCISIHVLLLLITRCVSSSCDMFLLLEKLLFPEKDAPRFTVEFHEQYLFLDADIQTLNDSEAILCSNSGTNVVELRSVFFESEIRDG
jgi:hypothetical protein